MRGILIVATLALVTLAGCADSSAAVEEPEAFQELEASKETGVIRGVVVDQTISPIPGAAITVKPGGLTTVTDEDGAFGFSDVEPGVYFIEATAPYHTKAQSSTEVVAGVDKPDVVRIALEALPVPVPAIQEFQYKFVTSASGWVAGVGGIVFTDALGEGHFKTTLDTDGNTTWVQSELVWTANQPLSSSLRLIGSIKDEDGAVGSQTAVGASPLLHVYDNSTLTGTKPLTATYTIYVAPTDPAPAGVAVNQDALLVTHAFQNFLPDEGWRFTNDGAHPVPDTP